MAGYLNHLNPNTTLSMKYFVALLLLTTSFFTQAQDKKLPQVELSDLYGEKVELSTITGGEKIIVIDFWATWCIPCKKSLNNMLEVEKEWKEKMERIKAMGVTSSDFPYYAGGDRVVNLTEHFTRIWDIKKKEYVRRVITYAEDTIELSNNTLEELIGEEFWPLIYWAEDPETNDIYPDSVAAIS